MRNGPARKPPRASILGAIAIGVKVVILALPASSAAAAIVVTVMAKHGHLVSFGTLQILNPYAALLDAAGIGRFHPGFPIGISEAMGWPGSLIGMPVAGALAVWLMVAIGVAVGDDGGLVKAVVVGIPLSLVGQFIVQRAFLDVANDLQRQEEATPQLAEELERVEGRALETVVGISRATACVGVFFDDKSFQPMIRLAELRSRRRGGQIATAQSPLRTQISGFTIDFRTGAWGVEMGKSANQFNHFKNYEEVVKRFDGNANVRALGVLSPFDPLLQIAMSTVIDTMMTGQLFEKLDRFQPTFDRHLVVDVKDTSPDAPIVDRRIKVDGGPSLEVKAVFDQRSTITVFLDMSVYRRVAGEVLTSLARLENPAEGDAYMKLNTWTTQQVNGPISHELWHFFAGKSVAYRGLPLALDEGYATVFQTMTEGMAAASLGHAEAISSAASRAQLTDFATREAMKQAFLATPSPTERDYLALLTTKALLPAQDLLRLENGEIHNDQPYAQGWLLALATCFRPQKIHDVTSAVESPEQGSRLWPILDALFHGSRDEMLEVRRSCIGIFASGSQGG